MRRTLKDFPGPRPKPHEMKAFLDDADEVIGLNGLTAIANGKLPSRVATLYTYSAELTAPVPPLAKDATASDVLTARKMRAEVEKYQKHNDEVEGRKKIAVRDDRNELFTLFADSMKITHPGLRDSLRRQFAVEDGFFDGYAALQAIKKNLNEQIKEGAFDKYYDDVYDWLADPKNRLKAGVMPPEFSGRIRNFLHQVNRWNVSSSTRQLGSQGAPCSIRTCPVSTCSGPSP